MKREPKTNRGKYNAIINKAEKILAQLCKLRKQAEELANECQEFRDYYDYDTYIYELQQLQYTAEDLAAFDFEDSIPERAKYNF